MRDQAGACKAYAKHAEVSEITRFPINYLKKLGSYLGRTIFSSQSKCMRMLHPKGYDLGVWIFLAKEVVPEADGFFKPFGRHFRARRCGAPRATSHWCCTRRLARTSCENPKQLNSHRNPSWWPTYDPWKTMEDLQRDYQLRLAPTHWPPKGV